MLSTKMAPLLIRLLHRGTKLSLGALVCLLAGGWTLQAAGNDAGQADQGQARPVAIVVHPGTNISNLTMQELREVFLAERQYWPDKSRIVLLVRAPVAYERTFVLKRIYQMSEAQFRRYWIAKMFRTEIPSGPRVVFSTNMARGLVTAIPGSITFMLASDVGPEVKVVRIDGKLPSEKGYPLR